MSQCVEMLQCQPRGEIMIDIDMRYPAHLLMPRDRYNRDLHRYAQIGIYKYEPSTARSVSNCG